MKYLRSTFLFSHDPSMRSVYSCCSRTLRFLYRTMSQQLMEAVQVATSPFQCAMSTKSGCEMDPRATVMSIDGISAYDLISRQAMMQGLRDVFGRSSALPFVSMFYGTESRYLEDSDGGVHSILVHVQSHLREGEVVMAFLDYIYTVSLPDRVGAIHRMLARALWSEAGIRVHQGKTQIWRDA